MAIRLVILKKGHYHFADRGHYHFALTDICINDCFLLGCQTSPGTILNSFYYDLLQVTTYLAICADYSFNKDSGGVIDGATVLFCAAGREHQVFVDLENAVMCPENSADRLAFTKCQCLRKNGALSTSIFFLISMKR